MYMSGYAQPILASHGAPGPEMNILEKPFTEVTLIARVHQALHQAQHPPADGRRMAGEGARGRGYG